MDTTQKSIDNQELEKIVLEWSSIFMRRSMHDFMQYARTDNLSMSQMNVLMWLYYHQQCEVMKLEEVMQVSRPAASQMVERMVQQGLVSRTESPTDRRARLVQLTEHGKNEIEKAISARQQWISSLIDTFDEDQKQIVAQALEILTQHATASFVNKD